MKRTSAGVVGVKLNPKLVPSQPAANAPANTPATVTPAVSAKPGRELMPGPLAGAVAPAQGPAAAINTGVAGRARSAIASITGRLGGGMRIIDMPSREPQPQPVDPRVAEREEYRRSWIAGPRRALA